MQTVTLLSMAIVATFVGTGAAGGQIYTIDGVLSTCSVKSGRSDRSGCLLA